MKLETKSVEIRGDLTLPYVERGAPAGVPVIFLHGLSDSWHSFERVLPFLPESMRAIALTQRGHGDASRPQTGYDPQTMAEDVARFMDELAIESAVIVGHSLGAVVVQDFALRHPRRTRGVALLSAFASFRDNPVAQELWESTISELKDPVDPHFVRDFQQSTIHQPVPQAFLETIVKESMKLPAHVWRSTVGTFLNYDFSGELDNITAPVLIVWGDRDAVCSPADREVLAAAIPSSRVVVYEGVGHAVHWEVPERVASDLAAFVGSLAD